MEINNKENVIRFENNLEIFRYHFPQYPIIPGAVLLDILVQWEEVDHNAYFQFDAKFLKQIKPGLEVRIVEHDEKVNIYSDEESVADILRIKKENPLQVRKSITWMNVSAPWNHPYGMQAKEILYLNRWKELSHDGGWYSGIGIAVFASKRLDVLKDISTKRHFGEVFYLVELFGVLASSILIHNGVIKVEDGFGLASVKKLEIFQKLKENQMLEIVVRCKKAGIGTIMMGEIYCDDQMVARLARGIGMPFINRKGEV